MFTGIVERTGEVRALVRVGDGARIEVSAPGMTLKEGASIAVDGVCLTAIRPRRGRFAAELSAETLARTNLGERRGGDRVNLERPLRLDAELGGHFVLGHVDGTGRIEALEPESGGTRLVVSFARKYDLTIADKGSVAVNGVSLTVARRRRGIVEAALIPHTLAVTNLGALGLGASVNLEFDYLAKLVLNLVRRLQPTTRSGGKHRGVRNRR